MDETNVIATCSAISITGTPESPQHGEQSLVAGPATNGDCGIQSGMPLEHKKAGDSGQTSHLSAKREPPTPDESNRQFTKLLAYFENACANYWMNDNDERVSDQRLTELDAKMREKRAALIAWVEANLSAITPTEG